MLFLDESGDHNLLRIDPAYPVFVLGGVIVDRTYLHHTLIPAVDAFKKQHFGNSDVVFHTSEIVRARGEFSCLADSSVRAGFIQGLNRLIAEADIRVMACVIDKQAYVDRYDDFVFDPYDLALEVLIERFVREIGPTAHDGIIVAERRGIVLDAAIERAWVNLCRTGTDRVSATRLNDRIVDLVLREKRSNIVGLQMADLVVSPIARYALGKPPKEDWLIVESKLCQREARGYDGHGLVVLPKKRG
ncbi:MAG: DUF3800 domain-containing protein [Thermomicrobiales bacterium]|nr:DUF3800 domain-containing protein [Thermomicrobiales bacterium]MCO5218999.1 DUF3800 domain-containing protein [Thermomicrobiales bacterium]MCO5224550.1 DUF3800 domain-containing protein [Thermomicrobiales bacterium]MCO5227308.1 DUF3800 domain-containing protein [Thermomicrobiales bacterium]